MAVAAGFTFTSSFPFLLSVKSLVLLLLTLCYWKTSYGLQGAKSGVDGKDLHYHVLHASSLLPSAVCNSSKALPEKSPLQVVHKHGPCYQLNQDKAKKPPTHAEALFQDQARVSSTGFLTLGKSRGSLKSVKFTPLSTRLIHPSFFGLDITGINVGGENLSILASVFTNSGAIIDSATVITRLPPAAYAALRSAFRERMSQYPMAKKLSILETCYDFSNYKSVDIPNISFFFRGDVEVAIPLEGTVVDNGDSQIRYKGDQAAIVSIRKTRAETGLVKMATSIFSNLFSFLLPVFLIFFLLPHFSKNSFALQGKISTQGTKGLRHIHIIQTSSLLPSTVCNSSAKAMNKKSSLEVVHKRGPCFQTDQDGANAPSNEEILSQDQARVDWIHSRLSMNNSMEEIDAVTVPTKIGISVGTLNYLVTVGFGTPPVKYALVFDTGSHFTWIQCEPCAGFCHDQVEPIFNPSKSKSYANISCRTPTCNQISVEAMQKGCLTSTCVYRIAYGDSSTSAGFLAKEKLTISRSDVFQSYLFGCGQENQFRRGNRVAGIIGLGRGKFSFVSQTAKKYNKIFSHCLPSDDCLTGYLSFGNTKLPREIKFTPMAKTFRNTPFYGLDIIGIKVRGHRVPIKSSVFKTAGAIIDSGTVITRLPPTAYAQFKAEYQKWMTRYPRAPPLSILDTCYDFSGYDVIATPAVSVIFHGGVEVDIHLSGILYMRNVSQACLAFAKNKDAHDEAIFGNFQQKTYEVVYDDVKGRVGFLPGGCP
ncbi:hypothetical protein PTKIN_Ptkin03bG0173500 [Pterospermum kingtungense]